MRALAVAAPGRGRPRFPALLALAVAVAGGGCNLFDDDGPRTGDDDDDVMPITDLGRGVTCGPDRECRTGLVCRGVCEPPGDRAEGAACQQTDDCADGLWCSARRACVPAGDGAEGDPCEGTAACARGLVCLYEDVFSGRCRATGTVDLGGVCEALTDCYAGLACLPDPDGVFRCIEPVGATGDDPPVVPPFWEGAACPSPASEDLALFDLEAGAPDGPDFFSLPFPNDVRRGEAGLDLGGFPSPGTILPVDLVGRYVDAIEADVDGFSINPTVWFRFASRYDRDSLCATDDPCVPRIELVDLGRPSAPPLPLRWLTTDRPEGTRRVTRYACDHWLGVRPPLGRPLEPGRTYAVLLRTGITRAGGAPFVRDADLSALLAPGGEGPAWDAYAPLRSWLGANGDDGGTVLNAAVFTTQTLGDDVPALRAAVAAGGAPSPSELTLCEAGVTSPCGDGGARECGAADDAFLELHGRLDLPRFQAGTLPFEAPEDGGALARDDAGDPTPVGRDDVCFALTVPRDREMPAGGWPLVVYLHGTGGSIRSAIGAGLAADLAGDPGAATLTIDLPMHGERRGGSDRDPDVLFYNFLNPRAVRDNVLQGTADLFAVLEAVAAFDVAPGDSPTAARLALDASRVAVFAHSQGATHAALALPWEDRAGAVVLSGLGGDLTESLVTKTEPVNVAGLLPIGLLDANPEGALDAGVFHPALTLFQTLMDRVDPLSYAAGLRTPPGAATPPHALMTYGLGDTYSPEPSMQAYALAADLPLVRTCEAPGDCFALAPIRRLPEIDPPASGNVGLPGGATRTMGLRQYDPPAGVDGHFVAWRSEPGLADTLRFLRGALDGQVPAIGAAP